MTNEQDSIEQTVTITREQALEQLRLWPRWVTTSTALVHRVSDHTKPFLALLRRVGRIAKVQRVDVLTFTGRAGEGRYEKHFARVIIKLDSEMADDDFFVRLDCENRNVRHMLKGGEDRLGKAGKAS
jgi:hypothetical protein